LCIKYTKEFFGDQGRLSRTHPTLFELYQGRRRGGSKKAVPKGGTTSIMEYKGEGPIAKPPFFLMVEGDKTACGGALQNPNERGENLVRPYHATKSGFSFSGEEGRQGVLVAK